MIVRWRWLGIDTCAGSTKLRSMCNLYSATTNQEAIRNLFNVGCDLTGNLPPLPGIFPGNSAPIVPTALAGRLSPDRRLGCEG